MFGEQISGEMRALYLGKGKKRYLKNKTKSAPEH